MNTVNEVRPVFKGMELTVYSSKNKRWLTLDQISEALGFQNNKHVNRLIQQHRDSMSDHVSTYHKEWGWKGNDPILKHTLIDYEGAFRLAEMINSPRSQEFLIFLEYELKNIMTKDPEQRQKAEAAAKQAHLESHSREWTMLTEIHDMLSSICKFFSPRGLRVETQAPPTLPPPEEKQTYGERVCRQCGQAFEAEVSSQVFCSRKCREKWYSPDEKQKRAVTKAPVVKKDPPPKTKTCQVCGQEYVPNSNVQKYCSEDCSLAGRYNRSSRAGYVCVQCGKSFVLPHGTGKAHRLFCSDDCRFQWFALKKAAAAASPRACAVCGNEFRPKQSTQVTCSPECSRQKNLNRKQQERQDAAAYRALVKAGKV